MNPSENGRGDLEGLALQPEREESRRPPARREEPRAGQRERQAQHVSPDPMSRTDRYRLVTPYWDRVDRV